MPDPVDPVKKLDADLLRDKRPAEAEPAEPVTITGESQLFVDDHLIERRQSLFRRLNRPTKGANPVIVCDRRWERDGLGYGCIVPHEGAYRLYYKSMSWEMPYDDFKAKYGYGKTPVCVAQSDDGITWRKDPIDGALYEGTNIVIDDPIDDFTVLKDEADTDPSKRFKLLSSKGNWWAGLTPATSPDGVHWTWGKEHAVAWFGDRCSYWFDPLRKRHVAWSRNYQMIGGRVIAHKDTADFDDWDDYRESHPRLVMQPDRHDHELTQIYGGYAFWYRSVYIAYLEVYYIHQQRIDTQLCCSRDGLKWERLCDREVFLRNGEHGDFDAYWIVPTFNAPISVDGELLIHYEGRADPHPQPGFGHVHPGMAGALGMARLREDGFVSLDATGTEGVLETRPLSLPESRSAVEVNVCPFNTRAGVTPMHVEIDVLGKDREPIASYAIDPAADGRVWYRIDLDAPMPQTARLRFRAVNARLYSFRVR